MSETTELDQQRLAFGRVAELYERARPSYPQVLIDAVLAALPAPPAKRVLEVGAGTGKATEWLAAAGHSVLALEPDRAMAAVARRKLGRVATVTIFEADFESFATRERFSSLVSVQAWHWTQPETRYRHAHQLLLPGGVLAAVWMFPAWERCSLGQALGDAYRAAAPELVADFPMHPASQPYRLAGEWEREVGESGRFSDPTVTLYEHDVQYTADGYAELLQTHQDHILLPAEARGRLLDAVRTTIDENGGRLSLPLTGWVCTACRQ